MKSWLSDHSPASQQRTVPHCLTAVFILKRRTQVMSPRILEFDKQPEICTSPSISRDRFRRLAKLLCLVLIVGCASGKKPIVEPSQAEGDATVNLPPVFGVVGWTNTPTQPMIQEQVRTMMSKSCSEHGLKANPLEEFEQNGVTLSRYECI